MTDELEALLEKYRGSLSKEDAVRIVEQWGRLIAKSDIDGAAALDESLLGRAPKLIEKFGVPFTIDAIKRSLPDDPDSLAFKVGDIIGARFPYAENPERPGPVVRPGLIIAVSRKTITIAYGSDLERRRSNNGIDFEIEAPGELATAGLDKPTRFTMNRTAVIPISRQFIDLRNGGIFGCVPGNRMEEFKELLNDLNFFLNDPLPALMLLMTERGATLAHGVSLDVDAAVPALRYGDQAVEFWPDEEMRVPGLSDVGREMIDATTLLSATEKIRALALIDARDAAA